MAKSDFESNTAKKLKDVTEQTVKELQQASIVIENSPVVLFRWLATEDWPVVHVSSNVRQFGYTAKELLSAEISYSSIVHPDDLERVSQEMLKHSNSGVDEFDQEYRIVSPAGAVFWVDDRTTIERDSDGKITHYQGIVLNITKHKQAEEKYRQLFERTGTAMAVLEADGTLSLVNRTFIQLAEADESEIIGHSFLEAIAEVDKRRMQEYHLKRLHGEEVPEIYEFQFKSFKGREGWGLLNLTFFPDSGKTLASVIDVTDRKQAEKAVTEAVASQNAILAAIPDLMFELDEEGRYLNIWTQNPAELVRNRSTLLGRTVSEMLSADAAGQVMQALREAKEKGQSHGQQIQIGTPDGELWFELSTSLKGGNSLPHRFIMLSRNITGRKQMEAELKYLSLHDPLTGLYNRNILEQELNNEIERSTRYNHMLSIFMLDIDHFKRINDQYGHHAGDVVLRKIAKILERSSRKTDYVARFGGEEFIIILPETPSIQAQELAERLRNQIAEEFIPIGDETTVRITTSIGVSSFPEHGDSWKALIHAADSAMYAAKDAGRNCVKNAENTV